MEANDFMDLNTTELFDDSNESFDKNLEGDNSGTISSDGEGDNSRTMYSLEDEDNADVIESVGTADAGKTSTVVSTGTRPVTTNEEVRLLNPMSVPTAVITPAIPSGLSIVQKCTKPQSTSEIIGKIKHTTADIIPIQLNIRPTTVISKTIGVQEAKSQLNSMAKYTKLHSALVSTMAESSTINAPTTKLVKIAPSTTSLSATTTISDIKTSPVIIVQTPAQKLGQKFTSLKILQKCQTPGSSIVKQKILNLNEMRKLNSGRSLKLLNTSAPTNTISDTNVSYLQATPSLIVLKPPITTSSATHTSTTLQLKPQQLYQTLPSSILSKPPTISLVKAPAKATSIAIGTKLIPSNILTTVKANSAVDSIAGQHPLPVGLTKIPKETMVNKIATKDAHGIEFVRMLKTKQSEQSVEPTVTIGPKQTPNKPPLEFQSLKNYLSANDKPKNHFDGTANHAEQPTTLDISNGKFMEKMDEIAASRDVESITISNGKLSNPNGSIKILKSVNETSTEVVDVDHASDEEKCLNKNVEKLKTSPRLQGRSKSLTIAKQQSKVRRRYPSDGNVLPPVESVGTAEWKKPDGSKNEITTSEVIEVIEENEEPTEASTTNVHEDEQLKTGGDSLECDEKIDDSDKSKSVSPDVAIPGIVRQIPTIATAANPLPISVSSSSHVDQKSDDPLTYIKWRNGTGYLRYSNLQFSKNEFNLLMVHEPKEPAKSQNNVKATAKPTNEQPDEIIDLVDRKPDVGDKSGAMGRKKFETKQRFKRAGMNLLQNVFVWELYLRLMDAQAAPDALFINPFPSSPNLFEVGMKMEAIDPEHCSLFCVCTVVEKLGYRIRLTFDGYGDKFSFWRNADSMDIFPPGWCAKTGRVLQPPLKYGSEPFDWHRYILKTNGRFAPRSNFTHLNSTTTRNPFKIGMKLEADHLKMGRGNVGIATIADVLDNRILLQFDGFDPSYDYWADITSPNIHPHNWHKTNNCRLVVSKEYERNFSWMHYLAATMSKPVPKDYFCPRSPIGFREGMKLEIVDKKVPSLIRPCTVVKVADYSIQVLFDGWASTYSYWIDDDHPDIHPINWCLKTEHPLEPPLNFGQEEFRSACGVLGCREVGNAKHFGVGFHYTIFECPYESRNWLSINTPTKPDRLFEINRTQKSRKRKARPIMSETAPYQKIKLELPPSEDSSLQNSPSNEWNGPTPKIKNEEIEIGETKLQQTVVTSLISPESSPAKIPKHIQVTETILRDYGPALMQIHKLWKQNSKPLNIRRTAKNPLCWSVDEVADYVARLPNCSKLGRLFREQEVDGDSFLKLCQNDLVDVLEIRMGPAVKIYNQIVALRSEVCEHFMD